MEKYRNLAKLCIFIPAFHPTTEGAQELTAGAVTSQVKEGKINGSWT